MKGRKCPSHLIVALPPCAFAPLREAFLILFIPSILSILLKGPALLSAICFISANQCSSVVKIIAAPELCVKKLGCGCTALRLCAA